MSDSEHEYIGPRCCSCCDARNGRPSVPHEEHACHPGPQWTWMTHKANSLDEYGRLYCSCSKEPAKVS